MQQWHGMHAELARTHTRLDRARRRVPGPQDRVHQKHVPLGDVRRQLFIDQLLLHELVADAVA